ncbi:MAG: RnfABCDGE type electron transport complex subunit G [Oscillospiraceae bacterium]|nr:RnfABCDGE type electron transport complex subunit G [Oscillospiraceae bacterium]
MSKSDAAQRQKSALDWRFIGKLGLSLFLITAIAALVLGLVNAVTADTIAQREEAERQEALTAVMPQADSFTDLAWESDDIDGITAACTGGELAGYCVEVSPNGFGGAISMMVGVDLEGYVTGAVILDHSETAGLGARADDPEFLGQYVGKTSEITLSGANAIDALSGATITSKAVTLGVNTAIEAAIEYMEGGADSNG